MQQSIRIHHSFCQSDFSFRVRFETPSPNRRAPALVGTALLFGPAFLLGLEILWIFNAKRATVKLTRIWGGFFLLGDCSRPPGVPCISDLPFSGGCPSVGGGLTLRTHGAHRSNPPTASIDDLSNIFTAFPPSCVSDLPPPTAGGGQRGARPCVVQSGPHRGVQPGSDVPMFKDRPLSLKVQYPETFETLLKSNCGKNARGEHR